MHSRFSAVTLSIKAENISTRHITDASTRRASRGMCMPLVFSFAYTGVDSADMQEALRARMEAAGLKNNRLPLFVSWHMPGEVHPSAGRPPTISCPKEVYLQATDGKFRLDVNTHKSASEGQPHVLHLPRGVIHGKAADAKPASRFVVATDANNVTLITARWTGRH